MNAWDLFTWIMVVILGIGSVTVFGFFLRDVKGILKRLPDGKRKD
jgi:hypothetical protein